MHENMQRSLDPLGSYLDDGGAWGFMLFKPDRCVASGHLNVIDRAAEWGRKALDLAPSNEWLNNNLQFFIRLRDEAQHPASEPSKAICRERT